MPEFRGLSFVIGDRPDIGPGPKPPPPPTHVWLRADVHGVLFTTTGGPVDLDTLGLSRALRTALDEWQVAVDPPRSAGDELAYRLGRELGPEWRVAHRPPS